MQKINTENIYKYLQPRKSSEFKKSLLFVKNQADLRNSWHFSKNQADLQNRGALQKNRRTVESLQALKSLRLVKNQRDWKKLAAGLLFRLGGISSC
jgi:hypothetical protein